LRHGSDPFVDGPDAPKPMIKAAASGRGTPGCSIAER
jgi:hypothetical protein